MKSVVLLLISQISKVNPLNGDNKFGKHPNESKIHLPQKLIAILPQRSELIIAKTNFALACVLI